MFNVYAFCLNLDKNLADLNLDRENIHSRELNKIQPTLWNFYFPCNLKSVAYSTEVNNVHQKKKKKKFKVDLRLCNQLRNSVQNYLTLRMRANSDFMVLH